MKYTMGGSSSCPKSKECKCKEECGGKCTKDDECKKCDGECTEICKAMGKNKNVMVVKKGCQFCEKARGILKEHKISFDEYEREADSCIANEVRKKEGHSTYPAIYLNGKFVGGCEELEAYVKTDEFSKTFGKFVGGCEELEAYVKTDEFSKTFGNK